MKYSLIFSTLLLFSYILSGQNVQILDEQNSPIENVIVLGEDFRSHTNANGYLQYFPENGTNRLAFIHPSYKRLTLTWDQLVLMDFKVKLEQRIQKLEEVTIRPNKRAQTINNSPQKVIALTPKNTALFQPQTTADLLETSGEVFIQKSQLGGGSPMIRGFSANRILLVVDGVRLNNAIYRGGNLHNVISMDASSLEQTEIILGPGSVIYGSDALGGVIHFYTLKPKLSTSNVKTPMEVLLRTSSVNFEKTAHMNFNLAGKKWASVTSLTFSDYDDLTMGSWKFPEYQRTAYINTTTSTDEQVKNANPNQQINTAYSQLNLIQKIRFRPSEKVDFEYAFHYSTTSDIPRYDRLIQYSNENLKYAEWYYGPQKWMMHSLKADLTLKNKIINNLLIQGAFQNYGESRHDRKFQNDIINHRTENVAIYSLNIDADKYFSKTQSLYYGIEGVFNKVNSEGKQENILDNTSEEIASRYPNNSEWWSLAAYTTYNQLLSAETSLQAGVRYNFSGMNGTFDTNYYNLPFKDFNDSNGALSVNFGLVFTPNNQSKININASSGFRSPNIDDAAKVFDSEPGNVIVPNTKLNPEYASSFEAGIQHYFTESIKINCSLYYTRLYNAMVRRDAQLNGMDSILYDGEMSKVQMLTNTSWANIAGLSTQILFRLNKLTKLKGGLNWQTGKDSDDLPVRHIAPLFGNIHAEWKNKKVTIDTYMLFNGAISAENLAIDEREKTHIYASDANGLPYSPSWWTLNIKGNYTVSKALSLNLGIENILDVRYRPYSSGIVAPGINFIFSANLKL